MTPAWVLVHHNVDERTHRVVALTATLDGARSAATDDLDPDWPALVWVRRVDGVWETEEICDIQFTAEQHKVTA